MGQQFTPNSEGDFVWKVGDEVCTIPSLTETGESCPSLTAKMSKHRKGRVITVPWELQHRGSGTVEVEWESLTGTAPFKHWMHSDFIRNVTHQGAQA